MKIYNSIYDSKGRFLSVEFIKKDGSIRKIHGRLGVKKYLAGGSCKLDKNKFIIFYDLHAKGYRAINKASILSVKTTGLKIERAAK